MNLCVLETVDRAFTPFRNQKQGKTVVLQSAIAARIIYSASFHRNSFLGFCLDDATGKYLDVFTLQKFQLLLVVPF